MAMEHLHTKTSLKMLCTLSRMDHRSRNRLLLLWIMSLSTPIVSKSRLSLTLTHSVIITPPLNTLHLLPSSMFNTSTTRILRPTTHLFRLVTLSRIFLTRKRTHIMPIPTLPPAYHLRQHRPVRHLRMHPLHLGHTRLPILTRMRSRNRLGITLQKPVSNLFLMRLAYLLGITTHIMASS